MRLIRHSVIVALSIVPALVVGQAPPASAFTRGDVRALWLLDEGQGQVLRDSKGNNTKGTLGSTAGLDNNDPTWVTGANGASSALSFDGDDFVDIRDSPTLESTAVTLAAVVRASGSPGVYRYVAAKGADSCEVASYALYTGPGGGLSFYVSDGSTFTASPNAGSTIWDGRWHTVVGTYDGSTVRLYVDGQQIGNGTPSTVSIDYGLRTTDRFSIGAYRGSCGLYFRGEIDGVAVLRKAVAATEIADVGNLFVGR